MMKRIVMVVGVALAACSSETNGTGSSSGGSACADISGNYSIKVERLSGTCPPNLDPAEASGSVAKAADGGWLVTLPGVSGGCPGTMDPNTCKFTSQCELRGQDGSVVGTLGLDYTFTASGYTGTSVSGLNPPAVETPCTVTYRETGQKL